MTGRGKSSTKKWEMVLVTAPFEHFDALETDCLILPFFEDDRPLQGLLGMADWRLNGKITAQVLREKIMGRKGETILFPTAHRLRMGNLLLLGLGPRAHFSESNYVQALRIATESMKRAKLKTFILALTASVSIEDQLQFIREFVVSEGKEFELTWQVFVEGIHLPRAEAWFSAQAKGSIDWRLEERSV